MHCCFERPIPAQPWRGIAVLVVLITLTAAAAWEIRSRSIGYAPTLNDTGDLWAQARRRVQADSLVIIGDSRALFDLDLGELGGIGVGKPFYDPFAFQRVTDQRFGNAGINSLRGPGFFNSDLGLFRSFKFGERFNAQFRAEYFNWTNTPKFNNPSSAVNNRVTNAASGLTTGFMEVTSTNAGGREPNGDRILRLGLKVTF